VGGNPDGSCHLSGGRLKTGNAPFQWRHQFAVGERHNRAPRARVITGDEAPDYPTQEQRADRYDHRIGGVARRCALSFEIEIGGLALPSEPRDALSSGRTSPCQSFYPVWVPAAGPYGKRFRLLPVTGEEGWPTTLM